jgi:flagellar protein FliJ
VQRFTFPLDKVLAFKERKEVVAEGRRRQAEAVLREKEAEVTAIRDKLLQASRDFPARVGEALDKGAWLTGYWQTVRLGEALDAALKQAEKAGKEYERALAVKKQAALEVEVLANLRQQRWQEHRRVLLRAEQVQLDEIGVRRWLEAKDSKLEENEQEEIKP